MQNPQRRTVGRLAGSFCRIDNTPSKESVTFDSERLIPRLEARHPIMSMNEIESTLSQKYPVDHLYQQEVTVCNELQDPNYPEMRDGCFVAGTPVWTDKGPVPIEQLEVGDLVLSQPEAQGERTYMRVVKTFAFEQKPIWNLAYISPQATRPLQEELTYIFATKNHPVWVKGKGWTAIEFVEPWETLEVSDGSDVLVYDVAEVFATRMDGVGFVSYPDREDRRGFHIDFNHGVQPIMLGEYHNLASASPCFDRFRREVYNIEVEHFHTYYVGNSGRGIWVHNINCATPEQPVIRQTAR